MTIVEVAGHGLVAFGDGDHAAKYSATEWLRSSHPAAGMSSSPARMHVEVLRRFGGIAPRALIGAQFIPGRGTRTQINVGVAAFGLFDADGQPTCPGVLWNQPFTIGLPDEFAQAAAGALGEGPALPAGTLTVDRAGFDLINSSEMIFEQAAAALKTVLAARLSGQDAETAARTLVSTW